MSYTVKEIADFLQVSKPTVRKYLNKLSDADRNGNSKDTDTGALIISDHCYNALIELYKAENGAETIISAVLDARADSYLNPELIMRAVTDAGIISEGDAYSINRKQIFFGSPTK